MATNISHYKKFITTDQMETYCDHEGIYYDSFWREIHTTLYMQWRSTNINLEYNIVIFGDVR